MNHRLTEKAPGKHYAILFWGIAALATGLISGGISWYQGCSFLLYFTAGAGFILSCCWILHINGELLPGWNGIQQYCPHWRTTRTGVLLYGDVPESPGIFMPWQSLDSATRTGDGILIETKDFIHIHLPAEPEAVEKALARILPLLSPEYDEEASPEKNPVYLQMEPDPPGIRSFLKVGIPWLIAGLILPCTQADEKGMLLLCVCCFGLAALFVLFGHSDFRDEYDADTYLGRETRHTRRGLHILGTSGWHYFQPWAGISECLELDTQEYFLKLNNSPMGINIGSKGKILPFSIDRKVKVKHLRWRTILNYGLCILFGLLGLVWWAYWH